MGISMVVPFSIALVAAMISPGASAQSMAKAVEPVLRALLPRPCGMQEQIKKTCDRQLLPREPCTGMILVTFNDHLGIGETVRKLATSLEIVRGETFACWHIAGKLGG
ncbi:hypothetical protein HPB52_011782 [Rhipicephalus sanguineus]|uniref:Uncharacterized protein n=1 Tax=Rhipicephalus sanguineus TaxID=34632 RepID=A0A9D4PJ50_RHISA|nr:hypothetical protein HPB52_011782 [Rhipicephalus sanguineus]